MAVAFLRGTTTGAADLTITVRDSGSNLIDPYRLEYAIYDYTTGIEVLQGSPVNYPIRLSLGQFYASVVIAADSNIGLWRIRWTVQEHATDPVYQSVQEFQVLGSNVIPSFTGNADVDRLIYRLRILLRDNNPDKNYRVRSPSSSKFIQGQTQVFGFIWEDEELYEYLLMAIDDFNSRPPTTGIDLYNLFASEKRWTTTIMMRAAAFACFAIAMNWIADEFSLDSKERITVKDENDNEYSLTMGELFDRIYGEKLLELVAQVKEEVILSIKELETGTEGIHDPYKDFIEPSQDSDSFKESFFKGTLKVRSMVNKGSEPEWVPLQDILRHHTPHKNMYRITTELGSVTVTEDHSLFHGISKEPIRADELEEGSLIIGLPGYKFEPIKILKVELVERQEYTYDVSVPDAENAVLDSGILVHNSYSISGVSLEIDKSSKYQALKDEYIAEYDKLVDLNKQSIKLIVGLRQAKYSVGITSALGPLSRPGVQSRRNLLGAGQGGF